MTAGVLTLASKQESDWSGWWGAGKGGQDWGEADRGGAQPRHHSFVQYLGGVHIHRTKGKGKESCL